jgi:hypothetical protein
MPGLGKGRFDGNTLPGTDAEVAAGGGGKGDELVLAGEAITADCKVPNGEAESIFLF